MISLQLLQAGHCRHPECMAARGGSWKSVAFPALCGLIRHPALGWILFDTGYAGHFFDATQHFPERLYRLLLPVELPPAETLIAQLAQRGLVPDDIGTVIVSHYHGDHIAGLRDFPRARFIALAADTAHFAALRQRRWRATLGGHLPALLPTDYFARLRDAESFPRCPLPTWMAPFESGFDLAGDGSLIGVPLPGHSAGQLGLFIADANGRPALLAADACWSWPALIENRPPPALTLLIAPERRRFHQTFQALGTLTRREPGLALLPSHCPVAWARFRAQHSHHDDR